MKISTHLTCNRERIERNSGLFHHPIYCKVSNHFDGTFYPQNEVISLSQLSRCEKEGRVHHPDRTCHLQAISHQLTFRPSLQPFEHCEKEFQDE